MRRFRQHYFTEIYSSWTYEVDNPYNAIYDFYAMSLINPEGIRDEDLQYSMREAKKTIIEYMKKFLLEQLARAVSAEISHYLHIKKPEALKDYTPKYMKSNISKEFFKNYVKEFHDKKYVEHDRKLVIYTDILSQEKAYNEVYELTLEFMKKFGYDLRDLFIYGKEAFDDISGWRSDQFGGSAWKKIAEAGLQVLDIKDEKDPNKVMAVLDHVFDLEHNTGSIFTKSEDLDTYKIKGILDDKRDITNEMAYYHRVSPGLKGPYAAAIRDLTGKTVEGEQPKIDIEDMINDVKHHPQKIQYFKNPPREVQQAAIDVDPMAVVWIDNPDIEIMKQAIDKNPDIFKYLKPEQKKRLPKKYVQDLFGTFDTKEPVTANVGDFEEI